MSDFWRSCSPCKKEIGFNTKYYECSVSTCTGKRTGYVFCSIACWERHLPGAKHRDAAAIEKRSPSREEAMREETIAESSPQNSKRYVVKPIALTTAPPSADLNDILVVVSKMKNYIRDISQMNTSGDCAEVLSEIIRWYCDRAIETARNDGRKTVMARDFTKPSRG